MKILAITNAVPDPRGTLKLDGSAISPAGVKWAINPYDEYAIEQAVRLREQNGDVEELVVMAVGGEEAVISLRHAMAMGADRGVHIVCDDGLHDDMYIARLIASAIECGDPSYDLILCGKTNLARDSESMGPAIAELLGIPHVGSVIALDVCKGSLRATHRASGANEIVELQLPGLVLCDKTLVEPRYPPLPKVMQARKKPIETIEAGALPVQPVSTTLVEMTSPAQRGACTMIEGTPREMAGELIRVLREEAKVL